MQKQECPVFPCSQINGIFLKHMNLCSYHLLLWLTNFTKWLDQLVVWIWTHACLQSVNQLDKIRVLAFLIYRSVCLSVPLARYYRVIVEMSYWTSERLHFTPLQNAQGICKLNGEEEEDKSHILSSRNSVIEWTTEWMNRRAYVSHLEEMHKRRSIKIVRRLLDLGHAERVVMPICHAGSRISCANACEEKVISRPLSAASHHNLVIRKDVVRCSIPCREY